MNELMIIFIELLNVIAWIGRLQLMACILLVLTVLVMIVIFLYRRKQSKNKA